MVICGSKKQGEPRLTVADVVMSFIVMAGITVIFSVSLLGFCGLL